MLKHEIAMSRGERLVCYFLSRLQNLKLTVHHATLRSHTKAFMTRLNRYSYSIWCILFCPLFICDKQLVLSMNFAMIHLNLCALLFVSATILSVLWYAHCDSTKIGDTDWSIGGVCDIKVRNREIWTRFAASTQSTPQRNLKIPKTNWKT